MNWWFIKMCILFAIWGRQYCRQNFSETEYREVCIANELCQYSCDGNGCYCHRDHNSMYALFTAWCVFWVIAVLWETFLSIIGILDDFSSSGMYLDCFIICGFVFRYKN